MGLIGAGIFFSFGFLMSRIIFAKRRIMYA
jgi:hypothetical protein